MRLWDRFKILAGATLALVVLVGISSTAPMADSTRSTLNLGILALVFVVALFLQMGFTRRLLVSLWETLTE